MKNKIFSSITGRAIVIATMLFATHIAGATALCDSIRLQNGGFINGAVIAQTQDELRICPCGLTEESAFWIKRESVIAQPALAPASDTTKELSLGGPRVGLVFFSGNFAQRIQDPSSKGGLAAKPIMSQFGYQFETAYINSDKVQVLFEFVPNVTGLDQGKFIPTFSVLNGVRLNKSGWEFIVGPIFYMTKRAEGFFDENGDWQLLTEWKAAHQGVAEPDNVKKGFDTRGNFAITTSFLLSVGKNFRSGSVNFPVNLIVIPNPEGVRFGVSVGFTRQRT